MAAVIVLVILGFLVIFLNMFVAMAVKNEISSPSLARGVGILGSIPPLGIFIGIIAGIIIIFRAFLMMIEDLWD